MLRRFSAIFSLILGFMLVLPFVSAPVFAKNTAQATFTPPTTGVATQDCRYQNPETGLLEDIPGVITTSYSYTLTSAASHTILPHLTSADKVRIAACVYLPSDYQNKVLPLLIFLHGQAEAYYPSYGGYAYLAKGLANQDQKYIIISIDANQANEVKYISDFYELKQILAKYPGDDGLQLARGRLVLKHLELWARWNAGSTANLPLNDVDTSAGSFDFASLAGKIDLAQIGMMGHSRGGEGVRAAYNYLTGREPAYAWPFSAIPTPKVRAIFEIASSDQLRRLNADGVVWNLLAGMCDGDVWLDSLRAFDRMMYAASENNNFPMQKSVYVVWGANHNGFNTKWAPDPEANGICDGPNNGVSTNSKKLLKSTDQQAIAAQSLTAFFTGNVGAGAIPSHNSLFNPLESIVLPPNLANPPRIERAFTISPDGSHTLLMEKFHGQSTTSFEKDDLTFDVVQMKTHSNTVDMDDVQYAGWAQWQSSANGQAFLQSNWFTPGSGMFMGGLVTLDVRLARKDNLPAPTDFSICLVYTNNGNCSQPVTLSSENAALVGPVGITQPPGLQPFLQTVRIPISHFCDITAMSLIRGVRFNFDQPTSQSGSVYIADIGFSQGTGPLNVNTTIEPRTCLPAPTNGIYHQTFNSLTWNPVINADSYDVYVWRTGETHNTPKANVTETQFSLDGLSLESGVQYFWEIVARADDGRFTESEVWTFTYTLYPYNLVSVWTSPEVISPEKNLPGLFDSLTYPNYAIRDFNIGEIVNIFMEFDKPTALTGFNAGFGGDANRFDSYSVSVQAADTLAAIISSPTQNILTNAPAPGKIIDINLQFGGARTAKFFKVSVRRNDGDRRVHIYEMRPLLGASGGGSISGLVLADGSPISEALVQVCTAQAACAITTTNSSGRYKAMNLVPSTYTVTAFPPAGSNLNKASVGGLTLTTGQNLIAPDLILRDSSGPPPGTSITNRGIGGDGAPIVYWNEPLTLTTQGCSGGSASYTISQNGTIIRSGSLSETTLGTYSTQIAPLYPLHGNAQIDIQIECPNGSTETITFNIYIDPSGWVRNVDGSPITGATVTLYRADLFAGPFQIVPNDSAIMSPANRHNPDLTDAAGHFGWDVIAGYYKVRAQKAGCYSAANSALLYAESAVLTIPPAVFDLDLRLNCPATATLTVTATVTETPTPTETATHTPSPSPTGTMTETVTATLTPTATSTLTLTPTFTRTKTPTLTTTPTSGQSVSVAGLKALLLDLKRRGAVDNQFYKPANVLVSLVDELLQARQKQAALVILRVFIEFTEQQSRIPRQTHITPTAAQQLTDLTWQIINSLR